MPTELPERFNASKLRIRHYGYLKARIEDRDKHARNLELLLKELERNPNDPFTHFNVGSEYVGMGDGSAARRAPRAGAHARPPRARLVGDRLRLAARLAPHRRAPR